MGRGSGLRGLAPEKQSSTLPQTAEESQKYSSIALMGGQMLATTQQMIVMGGDISGPQPASTQLSHFHGVSN